MIGLSFIILSVLLGIAFSFYDSSYNVASFAIVDLPKEILPEKVKDIQSESYERLEGVMIMQVYNSESNLVAYIKSDNLKVLKNNEIKQFIYGWPVKDTISKDGKEYRVLFYHYERKVTGEMETLGHFVLKKDNSSTIFFKAKHPQIHVVNGDVVSYDLRIFQPVL